MTIRKPDGILIFMLAVLAWLMIMIFSGCSTAKELIQKAEKKDLAAVLEYTRDKWPCTEILLPDTVLQTHDTLVFIDCPEQPNDFQPGARRGDTLRVPGPVRTIRVPVTLPIETRYITRWYEDSAKLKLGALALTKSALEIQDLKQQLSDMTGSRNWYRRWFWWLILIVGCGVVYIIFKIVK